VTDSLSEVLREIEHHVGAAGWDQPPRLFALANTAELARLEPGLGLTATSPDALTPIEQDSLPDDQPLHEALALLLWPEEVLGCALVLERVYLPPSAEAALPDDEALVTAVAQAHPDRRDVRIGVAVLRDGSHLCAVRIREDEDALSVGADLVPGLVDALAATLQD